MTGRSKEYYAEKRRKRIKATADRERKRGLVVCVQCRGRRQKAKYAKQEGWTKVYKKKPGGGTSFSASAGWLCPWCKQAGA